MTYLSGWDVLWIHESRGYQGGVGGWFFAKLEDGGLIVGTWVVDRMKVKGEARAGN